MFKYVDGEYIALTEEEIAEALEYELNSAKEQKLQMLKSLLHSKPRVTTTLGFDVDGGRDNKDDFFSKWEAMSDSDVTTVRDADNQFHTGITKAQMQVIYRAIVANGELLLANKWAKEVEVNACTTIEELDAVVI